MTRLSRSRRRWLSLKGSEVEQQGEGSAATHVPSQGKTARPYPAWTSPMLSGSLGSPFGVFPTHPGAVTSASEAMEKSRMIESPSAVRTRCLAACSFRPLPAFRGPAKPWFFCRLSLFMLRRLRIDSFLASFRLLKATTLPSGAPAVLTTLPSDTPVALELPWPSSLSEHS